MLRSEGELSLFKSKNRQHAFGLVEVLISVVILSIGLLGMASLQNATIQSVQDGDNIVSAAVIAQEMAKRMMSNRYLTSLGRQGYLALDLTTNVASAGGVVPWAAATLSANPNITNCYATSTSTSCYNPGGSYSSSSDHINALTNMELMDQVEMRLLAANTLPSGLIMLCFDSSTAYTAFSCNNTSTRTPTNTYMVNENVFTVKVQWTSILNNTTNMYALQFTAECDNTSSSYCG